MSELTLWKKQELDRLRKDMDRLFRRFRRGFGVPGSMLEAAEFISMDLSESENTLTLTTEIPGLKPEDIHISVTEDTLTLKGELRQDLMEKGENFRRIEKRSGSFSRIIRLPCRIVAEEVRATYRDQVLKVELPKCKPKEARGVTIEIKGG